MGAPLEIWTVYKNPSDYPGKYVVRRDRVSSEGIEKDIAPWAVEDTLEAARAAVPPGLVCLARHPMDDAVIVESWL